MSTPIARRVSVPRPKRARRSQRAGLLLIMHPRQLADLDQRCADASMSLGAFVSALLFSDEPTTCDHGVPLLATGAAACVRCRRSGK